MTKGFTTCEVFDPQARQNSLLYVHKAKVIRIYEHQNFLIKKIRSHFNC